MTRVRISLTEKDFADLVAGKVVRPMNHRMYREGFDDDRVVPEEGTVEIALQDIGWDRMYAAIDAASIREA